MTATIPLREHSERIKLCVWGILQVSMEPVRLRDLSYAVKAELRLDTARLDTLDRRCKEAVSQLVREGHRIVSDAKGYRFAVSKEDIAKGRRYLVAQIQSLASRLKSFDRAAGERVEQLVMEWGER